MRFGLICNTEKNSRGSSDHRVVNFDFNSGARNGGPCAIPFEASCSSFFLMLLVPGNWEVVEEDDDDEIKWMFEQAEAKACSMAAHSSSSTHSTGIVESLIPLSSSSPSPCLSSIWLQSFCSKTILRHCNYFANTLVHIGPSSFNAHKFRSLSSTSSFKNRITKRVHTVSRKSFLSFFCQPIRHFCIATFQALSSELRFTDQRNSKNHPESLPTS